jgi:hypothetical protein
MNRAKVLSVLEEDKSGIFIIFENNIDNLKSLTLEIKTAITTQEHASKYLKDESSCSETIEVMISSFKNIKSAIVVNLKNRNGDSDELKIYSVRKYIIELFSNLEEISAAIQRDSDALLDKYNEIIIELVSNYN